MKANHRFISQGPEFWAHVRIISQKARYSQRGRVKTVTLDAIVRALRAAGLDRRHVVNEDGQRTPLGDSLVAYFDYRARVLNEFAEPRLMDGDRARKEFKRLQNELRPTWPVPKNKQTGDKRGPAYFTGIINMLVEAHSGGLLCDYNPQSLTVVTRDGFPIRTLARRFDGAFIRTVDPVAVWEVKEYYNTTTFGSRVADAVYETQLDGMELMELRKGEQIHIDHYLFVDSHFTWWVKGKSYLCRLIDLLNMGLVDEVLFGVEVVLRLPQLVARWVDRIPNQQPWEGMRSGMTATDYDLNSADSHVLDRPRLFS